MTTDKRSQKQTNWLKPHLRKKIIQRLFFYQVGVVLLSFGIGWLVFNRLSAISILLGSLCWIIPSFYFSWRVFSYATQSTYYMLKKFYIAELLKLLFSAILIILTLKLISVVALPFFSGYIIALFSFWIISSIVLMSIPV